MAIIMLLMLPKYLFYDKTLNAIKWSGFEVIIMTDDQQYLIKFSLK